MRGGSGCRQAEAGAAREGRGHPEAGPVRREAGAQMKLRKELWFGFSLIALIILPTLLLMPWGHLTNGHLGLMMLSLIVVGIMMGFPTAFTLMGMGVFFAWLAYRSVNPALANRQVLDLFVQRTYGAFLPGFTLAGLYIGYVIVLAKLRPELMPPLAASERRVALPSYAQALQQYGSNALAALSRAFTGRAAVAVSKRTVLGQLVVSLSPALFILFVLGVTYQLATAPEAKTDTAGLIEAGGGISAAARELEEAK